MDSVQTEWWMEMKMVRIKFMDFDMATIFDVLNAYYVHEK